MPNNEPTSQGSSGHKVTVERLLAIALATNSPKVWAIAMSWANWLEPRCYNTRALGHAALHIKLNRYAESAAPRPSSFFIWLASIEATAYFTRIRDIS